MVILKGTWEYLMTISGGLKYLTEEISFTKNNLHRLTPHVWISHIPHIQVSRPNIRGFSITLLTQDGEKDMFLYNNAF